MLRGNGLRSISPRVPYTLATDLESHVTELLAGRDFLVLLRAKLQNESMKERLRGTDSFWGVHSDPEAM